MVSKARAVSTLFACLCVLCGPLSHADVALSPLFSDNVVLQEGMPLPVWGTAEPKESLVVRVAGQTKAATADSKGRWRVTLDPLEAKGPIEITVAGKNTITVKNVLVGEVWLASGQSNMQMSLRRVASGEMEIFKADYPNIRILQVPETISETPLRPGDSAAWTTDAGFSPWQPVTPETIRNFSAVAYYFGREIHKKLDKPIGLINASWGGTPSEAWTSMPALEKLSEARSLLERWKSAAGDGNDPTRPAVLYNGMISPLIPFAIRGVIWYQGEENASRAYEYRSLFPALIKDWRANWKQGDFPFLFVQLANYGPVKKAPQDSTWAETREAQAMALSLPNTAMAVAIDIGEADDIHPKNKQDVGARLSLAALATVYAKDDSSPLACVYRGPTFASMTIAGTKVHLKFDNIGSRLVTRGSTQLKGFTVAGEDRRFYNAKATILRDTVIVTSGEVAQPVAVRYAWADNPGVLSFYNWEGLPAEPFRTDDWPLITAQPPDEAK